MRISTFSVAIWLLVLSIDYARANKICQPIDEARKTINDSSVLYENSTSNWRVSVDKNSDKVDIQDKRTHTKCSTIIDDLTNVYFSSRSSILFRSNLVTSDDIYFVDADTCRQTRQSLSVWGYSASKFVQRAEINWLLLH